MATGIEAMVDLRRMTVDDLAAGHALSSEQKWPHRIEDWEMLLSLGLGYVAERDGAVIGTAMAWLYGLDAATLGMVIVSPAAQGMGLGRRLMEAVMADLGDRTILLNATDEGAPLYRKLGFESIGPVFQHRVNRFMGLSGFRFHALRLNQVCKLQRDVGCPRFRGSAVLRDCDLE